jgi:poly(A) polymerase
LAALLPADVALAEQVAARFRLSGAQKKRLALAAARGSASGDARELAYRLGLEAAVDRLLLSGCGTSALVGWEAPLFPLKGGEIVARGVRAGPEVARILRTIEARWVVEGFPDAGRVHAMLDELLAG